MGLDLLQTAEENYAMISTHLQRIRDLTEQAANGTYGEESLTAVAFEIKARFDEIDRISNSTEYNGINLMSGDTGTAVNLQVGISDSDSTITLAGALFKSATIVKLIAKRADGTTASTVAGLVTDCTGVTIGANETTTYAAANNKATTMLGKLDTAISEISTRVTKIGAAQNRV